MQTVFYGGNYREEWDDSYHLTVCYENQKCLTLRFTDGRWQLADGSLPGLPCADLFFPQAADAAVAARVFLASGLTEQNLAALAPTGKGGSVFAAECLRILMDDYGQKMETVYHYVLPCMGEPLDEQAMMALSQLQGRTKSLLAMLEQLRGTALSVRHDLRLSEYRSPFGAVRTGQAISLFIRVHPNELSSAVLELYGDAYMNEIPMVREEGGWRRATFPRS